MWLPQFIWRQVNKSIEDLIARRQIKLRNLVSAVLQILNEPLKIALTIENVTTACLESKPC